MLTGFDAAVLSDEAIDARIVMALRGLSIDAFALSSGAAP
jgi:hypothetical protein